MIIILIMLQRLLKLGFIRALGAHPLYLFHRLKSTFKFPFLIPVFTTVPSFPVDYSLLRYSFLSEYLRYRFLADSAARVLQRFSVFCCCCESFTREVVSLDL
ncbi:hypothetical protein KSP39_PZI002146 [Platanthera zijinensis]|uniref:Uncharacterized protein n=1 Tax=Platanthera zijinensis TaxID=2320716 RepID=A0AAP0BY03_9ASPA